MNSLVHKRIAKAVSRQYDMQQSLENCESMVYRIRDNFGDIDSNELLEYAIRFEVEKQRRLRSIEKHDKNHGDLFGDGILDKLISVNADGKENAFIKYRHATLQYLDGYRENQLLNLRKAHQAFERAEQRRATLLPLMSSDLTMTVEDALLKMGVMEVQN